MKLDVWHNDMWPRYKASVFSHMWKLANASGVDVRFFHIAETTSDRIELSGVDRSVHQYEYVNLFNMTQSDIPRSALISKTASIAWRSRADFTILAGYHRPEYWIQALLILLRGRRYGVFCDSTIYDNPQTVFRGIAKRIFFACCTGGFCYGQRAKEYLLHYGMREQDIIVDCQAAWLPNDYRVEEIASKRLACRGVAEDIRYLYVGRLSKEKRIDTLLRAFEIVTRTYPEAKLTIVGAGPERSTLLDLARGLGIAANTEFAGSRSGDGLWSEYLRASCLVLPSWSEPWGLVANEALSHGCPIIVSDRCGCVPELIDNGRSGFVFRCDDVDDLVGKLLAAPTSFPDSLQTTNACLDQIAPYTAANAAAAILRGACAFGGFPYDPRPNPEPVPRELPNPRLPAGLRVGVDGG